MTFQCELVALDLGNVLINFDHKIIARRLAKLSRKPLFAIVSQFIESGVGELFAEGKLSSEEFGRRVIHDLSLKIGFEEFKSIWNEIFSDNPGMDEIVRGIKKRYPVYVISDTNPLHFDFVRERFPILNYVDQFVLSYRVGARKPHPRVFEAALRLAGTSAEKTFFADDKEEVVKAASCMGFRAVQFKSVDSFKEELEKLQLLS